MELAYNGQVKREGGHCYMQCRLRELHFLLFAASEERLLPYVFRWDGGGSEVYLSGTFNDWETENIMMATNR